MTGNLVLYSVQKPQRLVINAYVTHCMMGLGNYHRLVLNLRN